MKFKDLAIGQIFTFSTVSPWRVPTTGATAVCRKLSARRYQIVATGTVDKINTTAVPVDPSERA